MSLFEFYYEALKDVLLRDPQWIQMQQRLYDCWVELRRRLKGRPDVRYWVPSVLRCWWGLHTKGVLPAGCAFLSNIIEEVEPCPGFRAYLFWDGLMGLVGGIGPDESLI